MHNPQKNPDPYCYYCNGTGDYNRADGLCHCTNADYISSETPRQSVDRVWKQAFERLNENVYPRHHEDPIMNFVQSLAYCDWYEDKSQKWIDEFTTFAADKIKEHFKGK